MSTLRWVTGRSLAVCGLLALAACGTAEREPAGERTDGPRRPPLAGTAIDPLLQQQDRARAAAAHVEQRKAQIDAELSGEDP